MKKHYLADSERALWAVGAPSSFLTLAHVLLSVSPFFSPLSLRHGFVVVCFEVTICELLCLDGLRHVISGILAGGIPCCVLLCFGGFAFGFCFRLVVTS